MLEATYRCPECGWEGKGNELYEEEYDRCHSDWYCPICHMNIDDLEETGYKVSSRTWEICKIIWDLEKEFPFMRKAMNDHRDEICEKLIIKYNDSFEKMVEDIRTPWQSIIIDIISKYLV